MDDAAIWSTVESLRNIFGIVLALSLGEAFKQIVVDKGSDDEACSLKAIRWDAAWALASFLLLLIPFYHGMGRYLAQVYQGAGRPVPYGAYLLIDVLAFTAEATLFFVMSRAVRAVQWRRFYAAVVCMFVVDSLWSTFVYLTHRHAILPWLELNIGSLVVLGLILVHFRKDDSKAAPIVAMVAMMIRTTLDYATSWTLYFPE